MNPIIKRELEKVRAPLPDYDDYTTLIQILREQPVSISAGPQVGRCYIIEIANYIIDEPPNFTLAANWNKGVKPVTNYLQVEVNKIMGRMIQVNGTGFNNDTQCATQDTYIGLWLPLAGVRIVTEL